MACGRSVVRRWRVAGDLALASLTSLPGTRQRDRAAVASPLGERGGRVGLREPAKLGHDFGRKALALRDPLDFHGDRVDGLLDPLEAVARFRVRGWGGNGPPVHAARDGPDDRDTDR